MGEETARLREEIDRTRADLTRDVDLITDRTSPSRIARRRWDRVRGAGISMRERVMGSAHDAGYRMSHGMSSGSGGMRAGSGGMRETVSERAQDARAAASQAAGSVQERASGAVGTVQDSAQSAVRTTRQQTEGNPLAAGLLAFGTGWLVSSLLPAADVERRMAQRAKETAREHSDVVQPMVDQAKESAQQVGQQVKESAQQRASDVKEHAEQAASTVADQGKQAGQTVAGEARSAGEDVSEQARTFTRRAGPGDGS